MSILVQGRFRRPPETVLRDAADAADLLVHQFAGRACDKEDSGLAYWLAGAAVASSLGLPAESWVRSARTQGATWQQIADALGGTRGNVHARYRYVEPIA